MLDIQYSAFLLVIIYLLNTLSYAEVEAIDEQAVTVGQKIIALTETTKWSWIDLKF